MKNLLAGILIGAGAILPGISSGVFLCCFGLYEKIVDCILHFFKDIKKNFTFLFPICLGVFVGVFLFGNILKILFDKYYMPTSFVFIGLILGSIPLVVKQANVKKVTFLHILCMLVTFSFSLYLVALEGNISDNWLNLLLEDEYYLIEPPKTTGREYFSAQYIENALRIAPEKPEDIIATLTALTAKSIAVSYERFVYTHSSIDEVILGGGGAYNPTLVNMLRKYLPKHIELKTHEDYGISNNFKEVMAFALLGYCTYYNIPNNLPSCTGAKRRTVLGKITY